jgi:hypothetical protein
MEMGRRFKVSCSYGGYKDNELQIGPGRAFLGKESEAGKVEGSRTRFKLI